VVWAYRLDLEGILVSERFRNGVATTCANISGDFTMYNSSGAQEAPEEYASCGHAAGSCNDVKNYFIDVDTSSWMSVSSAAASSGNFSRVNAPGLPGIPGHCGRARCANPGEVRLRQPGDRDCACHYLRASGDAQHK
jgi:hypothetical protein